MEDLLMNLVEEPVIEDASHDHLLGFSDTEDERIVPRVGDEYQVEVPLLLTDSARLQYAEKHAKDESYVLLPMPILYAPYSVKNAKGILVDDAIIRNISGGTYNRNGTGQLLMEPPPDLHLPNDHELGLDKMYSSNILDPVPGTLGNSWSAVEQRSFILGLYIFGKQFVKVKSLIGSKDMGEILIFYYRKIYPSELYRRWSECQKTKSKKIILGEKIFTGWRQNELLSRLLPHMSEEYREPLLEASRSFGEGGISLEDYVLTLKSIAGINNLIEAVGIGRGEHDLTCKVLDPAKTTQVPRNRLKVPVGKACSSLKYGEIVKFISGDVRLSKARSNDLFWEAVWPRLLAKGWHSEQPKIHHTNADPKHSFVFLVPGVEKYSRKGLVKGNQYFDSVASVLKKVASEPGLIMLANDTIEAKEGNVSSEKNLDKDVGHLNLSNAHLQCLDLLLFTTVDTSLDSDEDRSTVIALKTLPPSTTSNTFSCKSLSRENDGSSEESMDSLNSSDRPMNSKVGLITSSPKSISEEVLPGCAIAVLTNNGPDLSTFETENGSDTQDDSDSAVKPEKTIKLQFRRRINPRTVDYLSPSTNQRGLSGCTRVQSNGATNFPSLDANENILPEVGPSEIEVPTSLSLSNNSVDIIEKISEPRILIDLNIPQVPLDFEPCESLAKDVADESVLKLEGTLQSMTVDSEPVMDIASTETQHAMATRRQGTRNRPLTKKAMEALACEFLKPKTKPKPRRRGMDEMLLGSLKEQPLQQNKRRVLNTTHGVLDSDVEERSDKGCSNMSNMISTTQGVWPEGVL